MFELIIIIVAMFIIGYFNYTSIIRRSKSIVDTILNQKNNEEKYDEKNEN